MKDEPRIQEGTEVKERIKKQSRQRTEPEFVNVLEAQESIPRAYVVWRADTSIRVLVPTRWESIPGLLKRFTNSGSEQRRQE